MARRSGLGKGLSALIPSDTSGPSGSALREVPIGSVRPNTYQPRRHFDEAALASLAASIREVGLLQPVLVREAAPGSFELIAGERRWRAARRAGHQTIRVIVQDVTDVHSLEQALVENLHREDLNPLEEATAYQQLIDEFGYTHEQVAGRVAKSRVTVTNTLRLLQLPPGVQRALAEGGLTAGHARALLGTPDRSLQEALARRIVTEGLTVRTVEALVRGGQDTAPSDQLDVETRGADSREDGARDDADRGDPSRGVSLGSASLAGTAGQSDPSSAIVSADRSPRPLPPPGVLELEELLADHLNTRVKVDVGGNRGRVVIEFSTLEDLERIYRLMVEDG